MKIKRSFKIIVFLALCSAYMNSAGAQQLASEKPVRGYYPPGVKGRTTVNASNRTAAPSKTAPAKVTLASERAWSAQPSAPSTVKTRKVTKPNANGQVKVKTVKTASERPIDKNKGKRPPSRSH